MRAIIIVTMEILVLDGKNYVKASKAAKDLGYATDYVGQLCRGGQVDAHLIGRTWYVNQEELSTHRTEKKRISREKAREYAKKSIEEVREKNAKTRNHYENIAIQYEEDKEPLIPELRKIEVESIPVRKGKEVAAVETGDERTIINKGEKVLMSGDIRVFDVTDGELDTETTILEARPVRNRTQKVEKKAINVKKEIEVTNPVPKKMNFVDRLDNLPVNNQTDVSVPAEITQVTEKVQNIAIYKFFILLVVLAIILSSTLMTSSIITYTSSDDGNVEMTASYRMSYTNTMSIIRQKI